ncbi:MULTISPECIES: DUF6113 family protein [unclassified Microbispora]|uniref:DUF6113 family protein n=1 Tax=unclassified Microbispora TaxID=2614687 RepID=UPI001473DBEC|nr:MULTISPECIES: DUF6113 family protein [unclassified Microbispora]
MTQEAQIGVEPTEDAPGLLAGVVTGAAYGVLFLLGVVLGVVGGFQHAWYVGQMPVAAIAWLAVLFAVPYAMGRLMGGKLAALVPAVGWLLVSFLLATPQRAGDLAVAGNSAGYWYLYGGAVAVAAAVVVTRSTGSWLLKSYGRA